jgi:hypothetical protein
MKDEKRLRELFSRAQTTNQYGSLSRHLPVGAVEAPVRTEARMDWNFRETNSEQSTNQEKMHYRYGL